MANPYFIEPPNVLQALRMGVQGYDRAQKSVRQNELQAARQKAGETFAQGGDTRSVLGQLIGLGDAETVKALSGMGKTDTTNDIKEYNLAKEQGFKGSLLDYQTALKRAGANQTSINMPPMEKAYDQALGKEFADQNISIAKGAGDARRKIATLDRIGQLLSDPKIYTGAGGDQVLQVKRLAKLIGVDVGDVSGAEAARALSNQFALELRNPAGGAGMPGAMSDKDREFLQASVPSLQQSPQGNAKIVDYMKRVANRAIQVEKLRQDYVRKNGRLNEGFYQALSQFSEANPLFPEAGQGAAREGQTGAGVKWRVIQ